MTDEQIIELYFARDERAISETANAHGAYCFGVAMRILKSRLYDKYREEKDSAYAENRRDQIGTGDRSERIRTYNFHEGRVTDHRIGLTLYAIQNIMDGDLDEIIDALATADQAEKLKNADEQ